MKNINKRKKHVFMVGIKGVAMTSMAVYLKEKGNIVSGSDVDEEFATDKILKQNNIPVVKGFSPMNISSELDLVIGTGAHGGMTNPEMKKAKLSGIPTYMHGEYIGLEMEKYEGISVAGCHGKTTTSAMSASLLTHSKLYPSYTVGCASINDLGAAGHFDRGKLFIAEADEYITCPQTDSTPRFMWQKPKWLILTNIDYDHPDAYKNIEEVKNAYLKFCNGIQRDGLAILCKDDTNINKIMPLIQRKYLTYGFSKSADFIISDIYFGNGANFFCLSSKDIMLGKFMIRVPGKHNMLNAAAALIMGNSLGLNWETLRKNVKYFTGTKRRFEKIYEQNNILLYDDYAHHPKEIQSTISSFKEWFPKKRLIVLFQPHTYSRTKSMLSNFSESFIKADICVIPDIYPSARESFDPTITSRQMVQEINKKKKNAKYLPKEDDILEYLKNNITGNDLIVTMGAGDIFSLHDKIRLLIEKAK